MNWNSWYQCYYHRRVTRPPPTTRPFGRYSILKPSGWSGWGSILSSTLLRASGRSLAGAVNRWESRCARHRPGPPEKRDFLNSPRSILLVSPAFLYFLPSKSCSMYSMPLQDVTWYFPLYSSPRLVFKLLILGGICVSKLTLRLSAYLDGHWVASNLTWENHSIILTQAIHPFCAFLAIFFQALLLSQKLQFEGKSRRTLYNPASNYQRCILLCLFTWYMMSEQSPLLSGLTGLLGTTALCHPIHPNLPTSF